MIVSRLRFLEVLASLRPRIVRVLMLLSKKHIPPSYNFLFNYKAISV